MRIILILLLFCIPCYAGNAYKRYTTHKERVASDKIQNHLASLTNSGLESKPVFTNNRRGRKASRKAKRH